jgi:CheY-like chemotaxis protein
MKTTNSTHKGRMAHPLNNLIMVIGGDTHFSYLMQRYVSTSLHQITYVNFGDDVLARAKGEKPIAIVLEVDPPEMIGWHTLQVLKTDPKTRRIPVIVCSWLDEEAHGFDLGADCYLHMPILYPDFEAALADILSKEQNEKNHG